MSRSKRKILIAFGSLGLAALSCTQPFDPRAPLKEQAVVFSILSTDRTSQYVRLEHSYMPVGFQPLSDTSDNSVTGATVSISDAHVIYVLCDTTIPRDDTSRYHGPLRAYGLAPLNIQAGTTYQLSARASDLDPIFATVTVPSHAIPSLSVGSLTILDNPVNLPASDVILWNVLLGGSAKGYIGRLFVDYDALTGNEWVAGRSEIPLEFLEPDNPDLRFVVYPRIALSSSTKRVGVGFKNGTYKAILNDVVYVRFKSQKVIFNRVVFQVLQTDPNLFNYYNLAHAYNDANSMRLDEPMYSNISGGTGLFGAYTLDSLVHLLPENFYYNNN